MKSRNILSVPPPRRECFKVTVMNGYGWRRLRWGALTPQTSPQRKWPWLRRGPLISRCSSRGRKEVFLKALGKERLGVLSGGGRGRVFLHPWLALFFHLFHIDSMCKTHWSKIHLTLMPSHFFAFPFSLECRLSSTQLLTAPSNQSCTRWPWPRLAQTKTWGSNWPYAWTNHRIWNTAGKRAASFVVLVFLVELQPSQLHGLISSHVPWKNTVKCTTPPGGCKCLV